MPSHHQGPAHEISALDAYIKLMRATDSITARVHEVLPNDLTVTQFAVLEVLFHLGPLCQSQLAIKILKSTANLTLVIANLEKADLIKRVRQADDLRFITISLSPRGRTFIASLFPKVAARIAAEFSILSPHEITELGKIAKKLGLGHLNEDRRIHRAPQSTA